MFTPKFAHFLPLAAFFLLPSVCGAQGPNLGRPVTPEEIRKIDITVSPDGRGLPAGSGSVSAGAAVYAKSCQVCHGEKGAGKPQDQLTGGVGTLASGKPVKTPASYWPAATTLFDYIRRAMPITSPQSLTNDEVYAVSAYILSIDGIVPGDAVLDAEIFAARQNAEQGWLYNLVAEAAALRRGSQSGAGFSLRGLGLAKTNPHRLKPAPLTPNAN